MLVDADTPSVAPAAALGAQSYLFPRRKRPKVLQWPQPSQDTFVSLVPVTRDTGVELRDLLTDPEFPLRNRGKRRPDDHVQAICRLAHDFAESPQAVLQELVDIAVQHCGADSAGISLEEVTDSGERRFRWVALAGSFAQYVNGTTPRFFSPCGTCLDSGRPQLYRVTKPYYDFLGVTADDITDGMLIPWVSETLRGTIWAVAHRCPQAFDLEDYKLLRTLADFASMGLRHQQHETLLRKQEGRAAAAARSNELAHLINNPLQSLTNTLFLARQGGPDVPLYLEQATRELQTLSALVKQIFGSTGD